MPHLIRGEGPIALRWSWKKSVLWSALFLSLGCSVFALPKPVKQAYASYLGVVRKAQRSDYLQDVLFDQEKKILAVIKHEIRGSGADGFIEIRNEIFAKLKQVFSTSSSSFLIKRLDEPFLCIYFEAVAQYLDSLPASHRGRALLVRFQRDLSTRGVQLKWMRHSVYKSGEQRDRGRYHLQKNQIAVMLLRPQEFIVPLVHELVHRYDPLLVDLKKNLDWLQEHVSELLKHYEKARPSRDIFETPYDRSLFSRYFFIKYEYHPYYSELNALVVGCTVFVDLFNRGILTSPSEIDLSYYRPALEQKVTCLKLAQQDLAGRGYYPPQPFFKGGWKAAAVMQYRKNWLRSLTSR